MAGAKKAPKKVESVISWKQFFIAASVVANIGFAVVIVTMMGTHALDGMFMNEGLKRYCAAENNEKFEGTADRVKALRAYTCASGDAKDYFEQGFVNYLNYKNIDN